MVDLLEIIPGTPRDRMAYRATYRTVGPLLRDTGLCVRDVVDCLDGAFRTGNDRRWCLQPDVDFVVEMAKDPLRAILKFLDVLNSPAMYITEIAEFIGESRQAVNQNVVRAIRKLKRTGKFGELAGEMVEVRRRSGVI